MKAAVNEETQKTDETFLASGERWERAGGLGLGVGRVKVGGVPPPVCRRPLPPLICRRKKTPKKKRKNRTSPGERPAVRGAKQWRGGERYLFGPKNERSTPESLSGKPLKLERDGRENRGVQIYFTHTYII